MAALDGEILGPDDKTGQERERSVRRDFWKTLARAADRVPFTEDLVAAYYCALDPKTPTRVKATLLAALAYFVLPLDAIPDFLALVGFGDDVAVLTLAISSVRRHMSEAHRLAARKALDRLKSGDDPEKAG